MYKQLLKPLLFILPPERAHEMTLKNLRSIAAVPFFKQTIQRIYGCEGNRLSSEIFGLRFKNPVGLAAGMDKNADYYNELAALGFGSVEVGTVTPRPQPGNPSPRLFRLPHDRALINRMGFNNKGVDYMAGQLRKRRTDIVIGGNIGKNKDTPNEKAAKDYEICFQKLFDLVDYFVVNVSSPNTPGLRHLQAKAPLMRIMAHLQDINHSKQIAKPLLLKIAPDLNPEQLDDILAIVREVNLDGIIATNTTISREGLTTNPAEVKSMGEGGLSGAPLAGKSISIVRYLHEKSDGKVPIIGVGGIYSPDQAVHMINSGASLIQVYTGLIYEGPALVKKIKKMLLEGKVK